MANEFIARKGLISLKSASFYESIFVSGSIEGTASWSSNAITASFISTASWALNSVTAAFADTAKTASYISTASWSSNSITASYVATSSWALNSITASYVKNADTASYASVPLEELSDVVITNPITNHVLTYNGIDWINAVAPASPSAGPGIVYYFQDTAWGTGSITGQLFTAPTTSSENIDTASLTAGGQALIEMYVAQSPIGDTQIDAGEWEFDIWGATTSIVGQNYIVVVVYDRIVGSGSLIISGSGTSRIASSSYASAFLSTDADADILTSSYIETSGSTLQITGFTTGSRVTVATTAGYVNESGSYAIHRRLFNVVTPTLASVGVAEYIIDTVQPAFTTVNSETDRVSAFVFAKHPTGGARTISFYHNGTVHYSHIHTPMVLLHNELHGLQGGDGINQFYHLTQAQASAVTGIASIPSNTVLGNVATASAAPSALNGSNVRTIAGLATTDTPQFTRLGLGTPADATDVLKIIGDIALPRTSTDYSGSTTSFIYTKTNGDGSSTQDPLIIRSDGIRIQRYDGGVDYLEILRNGNVGIGTPTPGAKLNVIGVADTYAGYFQSVTGTNHSFGILIDAGTSVDSALYIRSADTTKNLLMVLGNGNIGIGSVSPRVKLDIFGPIYAAPTALSSAVTTGTIVLAESSGTVGSVIGISLNGSSYDTYFQARNLGAANTAYNLLLQPLGGNVGIGTVTPGHLLEVNSLVANTTVIAALGGTAIGNFKSADYLDTAATRWTFGRDNASTGNFVWYENGALRMSIASGANTVGIGTITPQAHLEIHVAADIPTLQLGTTRSLPASRQWALASNWVTEGDLTFLESTANNTVGSVPRMSIASGGNVGIGTSTPGHSLTVHSGGNTSISITSANIGAPGTTTSIIMGYADSTYQKAALMFESEDANGRGRMHVALNSVADSSNVALSDAKFTVDYSGNVGIGVVAPSSRLSLPVNKNIEIAGYNFFGQTYSQAGTLIGYNAKADIVNNVADQVLVATTDVVGYQFIRMSSAGGMQFHSVSGAVTADAVASSERMRITSGGNIGIGMASPATYTGYTTLAINNVTNGGVIDLVSNGTVKGQVYADSTNGIVINSPNTNPIVFYVNGAQRGVVNTVGLSITTGQIFVYGYSSNNASSVIWLSADQTNYIYNSGNAFTWRVNGSDVFYINGSQQVGIGTSPSTLLHIKSTQPVFTIEASGASNTATIALTPTAGYDAIIGTTVNSKLFLKSNNATAITIDNSTVTCAGNVYAVDGSVSIRIFSSNAASAGFIETFTNNNLLLRTNQTVALTIDTSQNATFTGTVSATSYNSTSAKRYKDNIISLDSISTLNRIMQLRPVSFDWKSNGRHDIGLIAEEVQEIFPEIISKNENKEITGLDYGRLSSVIIAAFQEQQNEINKLRQEIELLKNK